MIHFKERPILQQNNMRLAIQKSLKMSAWRGQYVWNIWSISEKSISKQMQNAPHSFAAMI